MLKTYAYEAFASQGNFMAPYSCYTAISKPYYPPLEPIAEANGFISRLREAAEGEQLADVGLVFSYAHHLQEFTFITNPYFQRVRRIADRLAYEHVLYDVVVFGGGEILPEFMGDPKKYPCLLIPECEVTEAQLRLIETFGSNTMFARGSKISIPSMLSTDAPAEVCFSLIT